MANTNGTTPNGNSAKIRITGVNKDKTRKANRSDTLYRVYFELSENPSLVWKKIFEQEWKTASASFISESMPNDAAVDRGYLAVRCSLTDVAAVYLPALKKAVIAANKNFEQYELLQAQVHAKKENIWNDERKTVEEMAKTLTFD